MSIFLYARRLWGVHGSESWCGSHRPDVRANASSPVGWLVLAPTVDMWDMRTDACDARIVHGIGLIEQHLRDQVDPGRPTDTLLGVLPLGWRNHAACLGKKSTDTAAGVRSVGGRARNARSRPSTAEPAPTLTTRRES